MRNHVLGIALALAALGAAADEPLMDIRRGITTWDEGIPLGNGQAGALVWGAGEKLNITLDRADLSHQRDALSITDGYVRLAADAATVYVALGDRKVSSSNPLLAWSTMPENVKFKSASGTCCGLAAKDAGLYPILGLILIFR